GREAVAGGGGGAAGGGALGGELGGGGGVAVGDEPGEQRPEEERRPGGAGRRGEGGEHPGPDHRPEPDDDGVPGAEAPHEGGRVVGGSTHRTSWAAGAAHATGSR